MLSTLTLAEAKRITLLMMIGCRDRVRLLFEELVHLFNDRYPDRPNISIPNLFRTIQRFENAGSVKQRDRARVIGSA